MTDYLEKYREALREGDAEKANKFYEKYRGEEETGSESEESEDSKDEEPMEDPSSMTVSEAKDYADELPEKGVSNFLDAERNGKNRSTLVDYLEEKLE